MRFVVAAFLALLPCVPGLAAEPGKDELAKQAQGILKTHCYRCHGQDGVFEGGMNYVLDAAKLTARKKIVAGKPDESPLWQRVAKGTMPPADQQPRPSDADKAILKKWIEAGAPSAQPVLVRAEVKPADLQRWMLQDLESFDRRARRFVRYFSLAHLYNLGLADDELQTYRNALSKLVNSLSWHPKISVPVAVDPNRTLLRIDLRWYMWDATLWNRILNEYPYGILDDSVTSRAVAVGTATKLPIIRADWFIATACRPPLYFDLLQLPASIAELERQLRVDAAVNIAQERIARAGFNGSGVSKNNRILERHDSIHGAYWRTYDFEAVAQNLIERGGFLPDQKNVFAYPLGPAGATPRDPFLHAGGEAIFNLPNGLHGFMLVNAVGARVDKAPVQIVSDPKRPDRAVETGVSCMSCHLTGINPKSDQVRDFVAKNPKAFSRADAELIRALYPPEEKMKKLMEEDAEKYRKAIEQTGAKITKTEPVSTLTIRYEADIDLPTAAAEAGFSPDEFRQKISNSMVLGRNLGALASAGGTVSRQVFVQAFGDIVRDLKLGGLLAANINSGALPDNTGDLDPLEGSANLANAVAITRDGLMALIASGDRSLKLWDIQAQREIRRFVGHTAGVWAVAFSADETRAVSGSMDGTARLWDVATGQELKRFDGHLSLVAGVAFAPDGRFILTGGYDGVVVLWDATGREVKRFDDLSKYIHAVTFSPDGKKALAGGDSAGHELDLETGKSHRILSGHTGPVSCVAYSPNGKWAATGSDDGSVRVWNLTAGHLVKELAAEQRRPVRDIAFAPSGKALLVASADRIVHLWEIEGANQAGKFDKHGDTVISARFINGGKQTMSASRDSAIKAWGISKHAHLVIAPDVQTPTNTVQPATTEVLKPTAVFGANGTIGNLMLSPNGRWLYFINRSTDKLIQVDTTTMKQTRDWTMPGGEAAVMTRDGKSLYALGHDHGKAVIVELDPISLSARRKAKFDLTPYDLAVTDKGIVYLTGETGGWTDIAIVDMAKQSIVGRWGGVWNRSFIQLSADQSRLYTSTQGVNPGKVEGFPIPVKFDEKPTPAVSPNQPDLPLGGEFTLTPDGKFLIARSGSTLRLANTREEDLQPGPKLPPNLGVAVDVARGLLILLAVDGVTLKRYTYPAMQWQANDRLATLAHELAYDARQSRLYLAAIDAASLGKPRARGFGQVQVIQLGDDKSPTR